MTLRHRFTLVAQRPLMSLPITQDQEYVAPTQRRWWLRSLQDDALCFECERSGALPLDAEYRFMMNEIDTHLAHQFSWRSAWEGWGLGERSQKWYPRCDGLLGALDHVYARFAAYRRSGSLNSSPISPLPEETARALRSGPLREIAAEHISRYAFKAMTTSGDREAFLHYLPRILEVITMGEFTYDEGVIISKLECADFARWPESERECVQHLFAQWVADSMHNSALPMFWDRYAIALGLGASALPDLSAMTTPIFRALEIAEETYDLSQIEVRTLTGSLPFWRALSPEQSDELKRWLSAQVLATLERVALSDLSSAAEASALHEQLEYFLQSSGGV